LLFAGTEREVVFSADDGENWQSLRMKMPGTVPELIIPGTAAFQRPGWPGHLPRIPVGFTP
jgi:hypothetical protein